MWIIVCPSVRGKLDDAYSGEFIFIKRAELVRLLVVPTAGYALRARAAATALAAPQPPQSHESSSPASTGKLLPTVSSNTAASAAAASDASAPPSRLDALPLELVDLIFAYISTLDDYFAVGYALPRMWPIVLRHADALYAARAHGSWARWPLISVGSTLRPNDVRADKYPPGLLDDEDVGELRAGIDDDRTCDMCPRCSPTAFDEMSLFQIASRSYTSTRPEAYWHHCCSGSGGGSSSNSSNSSGHSGSDKGSDSDNDGGSDGGSGGGNGRSNGGGGCGGIGPEHVRNWIKTDGLLGGFERSWEVDWDERRELRRAVFQSDARYAAMHADLVAAAPITRDDRFPPNEAWVLRNLTTRQLVRAEALAPSGQNVCGPFVGVEAGSGGACAGGASFGDVVALRTRFGSQYEVTEEGEERSEHEGLWVGHCFHITTLEPTSSRSRLSWSCGRMSAKRLRTR
jgi:uncharacterized membrane protein YgcG